MKIGDKLIVGVQIDIEEENIKVQIDDIDFSEQVSDGTFVVYEDMEDALKGNSSSEKIVIFELVDFGSVSTNPKFKSEKPEPKPKKSK